MIGDKQNQNVGSSGLALQAARDIHYHGPSVTEIKELCELFLEKNFPILRQEAIQAAQQQVKDFSAVLEKTLIKNSADLMIEKFREPDVQAAINDAVQACARKGAKASPDLLSNLIVERISKQSSDYKDIVLNEAIQVIPRLTPNQISFIAFHHFCTSISVGGLTNTAQLEDFGRKVLAITENGIKLSDSQKKHIEYTGALTISALSRGDIYDMLAADAYKYLNFENGAQFKAALTYSAPSFNKLLAAYETEQISNISLTSVGQAIALAHLSNALGKIDYSIWIA